MQISSCFVTCRGSKVYAGTLQEMACDETLQGKSFKGLPERCFKQPGKNIQKEEVFH